MVFIVLLLLIPACFCTSVFYPVDCNDVYVRGFGDSGVYTIYPAGPVSPVQVYCEMDPDGQWTVLQKRFDGSVNFYAPWAYFKAGFGKATGEYWLGLENIHLLTMRKAYELRFDLEDFIGNKVYATYSSFSVGSESEDYELGVGGFTNGGAGDSLGYHNGKKFTTWDRDNDNWGSNCAFKYKGGWWYGSCHTSNPNGIYAWGPSEFGTGINWNSWRGYEYSLKAISMKIKPVVANTP
ncbi:microfibril-associated glycoprotein 4-like [Cynoglossus semilaevis]|uniref:Microfibril associated protein 4, tandem duplicate 5 n=1 Tax=Cynoglossus semilaevis TaxID=244447 RepID=A0A3P8X4A4_CYNSE|nr:microfibril-associated glycoprotein 4-like [Cynoglossus semilaevis]